MQGPSPRSVQERLRVAQWRRLRTQESWSLPRIQEYWAAFAAGAAVTAAAAVAAAAAAADSASAAASADLPSLPDTTAAAAVASAVPVGADSTASQSGASAAATAADNTLSVFATAATATAPPAKFARVLRATDAVIELDSDTECIDLCTQFHFDDTPFDNTFEHYQRAERADDAGLWRAPAGSLDN